MEPNTSSNTQQLPVQPPTAEVVPEQLPPDKSPFSKWLLVFAGLILLTIVISGTYFLGIYQGMNQKPASKTTTVAKSTPTVTPTPDPTATWKTYTNPKLNYEIKYPDNLKATEQDMGNGDILVVLSDMNLSGIFPTKDEILVPVSNCIQGNCDQEIDKGYQLLIRPISDVNENLDKLIVVQNPPIVINNAQVYKSLKPTIFKKGGFQQGSNYAVALNKTRTSRYDLEESYNADKKEYSVLFNQILSTFKFTNQTSQTGETANLTTYANTQYGFSFKYPGNWLVENNVSSTFYAQEMINPITISDQNSFSADIRVIENTGNISAKDFILKYFNPHNLDTTGNIIDPTLKDTTFTDKTINRNKVTIINGLVGISGAGGPKAYLSRNSYSVFIEARSGITPPLSEKEVQNRLENFLSTFIFAP